MAAPQMALVSEAALPASISQLEENLAMLRRKLEVALRFGEYIVCEDLDEETSPLAR